MSKKSQKAAERAEAIKTLKGMLKPGSTVYCSLKHVSSSGMLRVIDLLIAYRHYENVYPPMPEDKASYPGQTDYTAKPKRVFKELRIRSIGYLAARAMDSTWDSDRGGIRMGGCGMDMGFAAVYNLGAAMWPKGTPNPHGRRNGEPDSAGGYALKHSWL